MTLACQPIPWTCLRAPAKCRAACRTTHLHDAWAWMPTTPNHDAPSPVATSYPPFNPSIPKSPLLIPPQALSRMGPSCLQPTPSLVGPPHQGASLQLQSHHGTSNGGTHRTDPTAIGRGRIHNELDLRNSPGHKVMEDADSWCGAQTQPSGSCKARLGPCLDRAWLGRSQAPHMAPQITPPMLAFDPPTYWCISRALLVPRVGSEHSRVSKSLRTGSWGKPHLPTTGGVTLLGTVPTLQPIPTQPPGTQWLRKP